MANGRVISVLSVTSALSFFSCTGAPGEADGETSVQSQPLHATLGSESAPIVDDPHTAAANAVVRIAGRGDARGMACTGVLVTPLLALTAAHCAKGTSSHNGWDDFPFAPKPQISVVDPNDDSVRTFTLLRTTSMLDRALRDNSLTDIASDVALAFIDPAKIDSQADWTALLGLRTARPTFRVANPPLQAVGATSDPAIRKLVSLDPVTRDPAGYWFIRSRFPPGIQADGGDSGGPLFVDTSGVRDPVGLISGVAEVDGDPYTYFADLT